MSGQMLDTLYSSADAAPTVISAASGVTTIPAGGSLVLWSHQPEPYALSPSGWDPSSETGLATVPGAQVLATGPQDPGSTLAESLPDGSAGAVINSAGLAAGGQLPDGPVPLIEGWTPGSVILPFADPSVQALDADVTLQVPYAEQPGSGSSVSSGQIVLYIGLEDTVSGRELAYGLTLFDSRGTSAPYFGIDDGPGGTGAAVVTEPAGAATDLDDAVPGSAAFQGGPWTGLRGFDFEITPQTLAAAIVRANAMLPAGAAPFSTDPADYAIQDVSVDAEVEYAGQPESFAYSTGSLGVAELAAPAGQPASQPSAVTSPGTNTISNGSLPETVRDSPSLDYVVSAGPGSLDFEGGGGSSTVWGGAGPETVMGGAGRVTATGGAGPAFLEGGSAGGNLLAAGAGSATLSGSASEDRDTLYGGQAGSDATLVGGACGSILVAGAGNTVLFAASGASTLFGAAAGGSATLVGGQEGALMAAAGGRSVIYAGEGVDTVFGSRPGGESTIVGGASASLVVLGGGADTVSLSSGAGTIFTGPGSSLVDTGSGRGLIVQAAAAPGGETVSFGSGDSTVFGGVDQTTYTFDASFYRSAATDLVVGFNPQADRIAAGPAMDAAALASAREAGGMTLITLGSATVAFIGNPTLTALDFT